MRICSLFSLFFLASRGILCYINSPVRDGRKPAGTIRRDLVAAGRRCPHKRAVLHFIERRLHHLRSRRFYDQWLLRVVGTDDRRNRECRVTMPVRGDEMRRRVVTRRMERCFATRAGRMEHEDASSLMHQGMRDLCEPLQSLLQLSPSVMETQPKGQRSP